MTRDREERLHRAKWRSELNKALLILLVEDEYLIRDTLELALQEGGYSVLVAENGSEAMTLLDEGQELAGLVTDIRLGTGASGWDVGRHARQLHPQLAIVYMTGDSAHEWASEGVPKSVLLQKPFAQAQMLTAMSTLLNEIDSSALPPAPHG